MQSELIVPVRRLAASGSELSSALRSLVIAALVGCGLATTVYMLMDVDELRSFVMSNRMGKDVRKSLLVSMFASAAGGTSVALLCLGVARWRGWSIRSVERWLWLCAPLALTFLGPVLFRYRPWVGRGAALLPLMFFVMLATEAIYTQTFSNIPEQLSRLSAWVQARTPRWLKRNGLLTVVVAASLGYTLFFGYFSILAHYSLSTHNFDLGINNNLIYGALEGRFMESPVTFGDNPGKYIGAHVKIGQYFFLPIYAFMPKAETLLGIQAAAVGLSAIPLFLFARRHIPQWMAAIAAFAFLSYHPTHGANFFEMKWLPVATLFVMLTVWAVDSKRWFWCAVFFVMATLTRDDTPIGMIILGFVLAVSGYRTRAGILMLVTAGIWFAVLRKGIMVGHGDWWFPKMYKGLWPPGETGFDSVVKTLLTNPMFVIKKVIIQSKLHYILHMLLPVAFIPARRAYLWLAFIPGFVATLMTTGYKPTITPSFHYVMHWTPYVFLAIPVVLASMIRTTTNGRAKAAGAIMTVGFVTAVLSYNYGAFPMRDTLRGGYTKIDFDYSEKDKKRYEQLMTLVAMIPPDATVSATETVGAHVSSRSELYAIRLRWGKQMGEYVLLRKREIRLEATGKRLKEVLKTKKSHGVFARKGEFALLKRGHSTAGNARLVREWRIR